MRKNYFASIATLAAVIMIGLTGCKDDTTLRSSISELPEGGTLCIRVNPEIAISYDAAGLVTGIDARNDDGEKIIASYSGYKGKECREVVGELVNAIGAAGYFIEEIEGESCQIIIEIEDGSEIPDKNFLDDVLEEVHLCITENSWNSPIEVEGESDYGITDYGTDYGIDNDGITDYDGPNNDNVTDYDDTDYGPNNDGVTDYDDTDYDD